MLVPLGSNRVCAWTHVSVQSRIMGSTAGAGIKIPRTIVHFKLLVHTHEFHSHSLHLPPLEVRRILLFAKIFVLIIATTLNGQNWLRRQILDHQFLYLWKSKPVECAVSSGCVNVWMWLKNGSALLYHSCFSFLLCSERYSGFFFMFIHFNSLLANDSRMLAFDPLKNPLVPKENKLGLYIKQHSRGK